ncbi:MAG: hypothetical protein R3F36_10465 [Candidatus Competibacteraceae bacterium]
MLIAVIAAVLFSGAYAVAKASGDHWSGKAVFPGVMLKVGVSRTIRREERSRLGQDQADRLIHPKRPDKELPTMKLVTFFLATILVLLASGCEKAAKAGTYLSAISPNNTCWRRSWPSDRANRYSGQGLIP